MFAQEGTILTLADSRILRRGGYSGADLDDEEGDGLTLENATLAESE
jgi:hypothetical protein